jgi:hypothetical protein
MRVRRESLLLLGVLTAVCALAGIIAGIATGALVESPPTAPPTHPYPVIQPATLPAVSPTSSRQAVTPSEPGRQWALLVIGVDDLSATDPRFEGCWVLTYTSGDTNYYGLSFPPGAVYTVPGLDGPRTLAEVYQVDRGQQRGFTFLRDAVQSRFRSFTFDADVVLDRGDFLDLAAAAGGLSVLGQAQSSADLLQAYEAFTVADEAGRVAFQQQSFEALFGALSLQGWTAKQVADHLKQLPQLQNDPDRAAALDAFAANAPSFATSVLNWTPLTP